jgi:hypothetical protein
MKVAGKNIDVTTFGIFGAIVLVIAYYIGSRTGKAKATASMADQLAKDIRKEDLTYDLSQYSTLADRVFMCVYDITEDEEGLYVVFGKMRNNSDVMQLISSFGKRGGGFDFWFDKTLPEWLASDLNNVEIGKINDILKSNSITYQF